MYTYDNWHIDGLVQERRNSSALAMELRLSGTNPSILQYGAIIKLSIFSQTHTKDTP